jgi:hypothetical protein
VGLLAVRQPFCRIQKLPVRHFSCSQQFYDHHLDGKATSRQFGNALEPEELSPRHMGQARLLVRRTPGQMVELIEWTDFVKYLDELRRAL